VAPRASGRPADRTAAAACLSRRCLGRRCLSRPCCAPPGPTHTAWADVGCAPP